MAVGFSFGKLSKVQQLLHSANNLCSSVYIPELETLSVRPFEDQQLCMEVKQRQAWKRGCKVCLPSCRACRGVEASASGWPPPSAQRTSRQSSGSSRTACQTRDCTCNHMETTTNIWRSETPITIIQHGRFPCIDPTVTIFVVLTFHKYSVVSNNPTTMMSSCALDSVKGNRNSLHQCKSAG